MARARKPRSDAKMYQLPKHIQDGVNERLINYNMSYADIIAWLEEQGYKVSQSSLSRYALKVFKSAQRIADDLEKTKYIVDTIGRHPDLDTMEATTAILKSGLLQRISSAEEEFNEMPLEKAGKLVVQISRAEADRKRTNYAAQSKADLAFNAFEDNIMQEIKNDDELLSMFKSFLERYSEKRSIDN